MRYLLIFIPFLSFAQTNLTKKEIISQFNITEDKFINVRKTWVERKLPTKNYRSNSKICKTCPIQKACADAGEGVVKMASMEQLSETM